MLFATSHDLQEPLRSIQIFCQKLEREIPVEPGTAARESMRTIADGARQISLLVAGLSAYSRSGRPMAAFVPVDCAKAAEAAWSDCKNTLGAPEILGVHWDSLPVVSGDPVLLVMLFHNLFANAIKFARPGVPPKVAVHAERDGGGWRIDVGDNGIGIEPAIGQVTGPFARLHPRAQYPGGMDWRREDRQGHGGRLWLDRPRKGHHRPRGCRRQSRRRDGGALRARRHPSSTRLCRRRASARLIVMLPNNSSMYVAAHRAQSSALRKPTLPASARRTMKRPTR